MERDTEHVRRVRAIERVCLGFAALGTALPFAYDTPLFRIHRDAVGACIGDASLATSSPTLALCLGMTGGTIAGKWIAHYAIARVGLRARWRWAREAMLAGLVSWLVLDTAVSLAVGAWTNAVLVNPAPVVLLGPLLARVWSHCDRVAPRSDSRLAMRVSFVALIVGAGSGVMIALAGDGAFAAWRDALSAAHFGGAEMPDAARALVRVFLGPIGGSTLAQYAMLAWLVRHANHVGERRALAWSLASLATWFGIDSTWSVASSSAFNVWMVNVPAMLLTAGPLVLALATEDRAASWALS